MTTNMPTPKPPPLRADTHTEYDTEPYHAIWVDLKMGREWKPWFCYFSLTAAKEVRDHFKGIKRLDDYGLFPSGPVSDARVREVRVDVTIHQ